MSRRWLCLALLLLSACYRNNPLNCVATPGICGSAEICSPLTERCVDPSKTPTLGSIDKTFIKADGGEVVVITGTGFREGMQILFNNDPVTAVEPLSSTQLRVTTPFRAKGTNKCGKLPLTVIGPDQTRTTAPDFFAYYFDSTNLFTHPPLDITLTTSVENLLMADLNLDGVDELTASRTNQTPLIFSSSAGMPTPPGIVPPSARPGTWVAADLETSFGNLIVADAGTGVNHVYRYAKGASLQNPSDIPQFLGGAKLVSVVAVDLDADGFRDIIGLQDTGQLAGIIRSPDWMITQEIQTMPLSITATSFVADRYFAETVHVAVVSANDTKLEILRYERGTRKLRPDATYVLPDKTVQILDGDVDGDGGKDLVVLMQTGAVKIFLNKGSFSDMNTLDFTFATTLSAGVVGDLNCDGVADVVGLNTPNSLQVWSLRTGVMPKVSVTNSGKPGSTIADFDGDAIGDLILFNAANQPLLRYGTVKQ